MQEQLPRPAYCEVDDGTVLVDFPTPERAAEEISSERCVSVSGRVSGSAASDMPMTMLGRHGGAAHARANGRSSPPHVCASLAATMVRSNSASASRAGCVLAAAEGPDTEPS